MNRTFAIAAVAVAAVSLFACSQRTQDHAAAAADQAGSATVSEAEDTGAAANAAAADAAAGVAKADRKADAAADAAAKTN